MEQTKALTALEPFLALTKTATSPRAAADLVTRATSHPSTFLFSDLLASTSIQSLAGSEFAPHLSLLEIFAHGTCQTYRDSTTQLPALTPPQALKLRQLSLLTLASDRSNLTYDALLEALALPSDEIPTLTVRMLEDLVISAFYAELLDGSLDPRRRCVRVNSVAPLRDLAPGAVAPMADVLRAWSGRCSSALEDLESRIFQVRWDAMCRQRRIRETKERSDRLIEEATKSRKASDGTKYDQTKGMMADMFARDPITAAALLEGRGRHGHGKLLGRGKRMQAEDQDDEAMDVDEDEGEKKRNKRG